MEKHFLCVSNGFVSLLGTCLFTFLQLAGFTFLSVATYSSIISNTSPRINSLQKYNEKFYF